MDEVSFDITLSSRVLRKLRRRLLHHRRLLVIAGKSDEARAMTLEKFIVQIIRRQLVEIFSDGVFH